jgi:hypothetical protein
MDTYENVGFVVFKNKDSTPRKFMVTHYYGFVVNGKNDKPSNSFIEDGKFHATAWDPEILREVQKLEIGDKHSVYGAAGTSHCAIYRYA